MPREDFLCCFRELNLDLGRKGIHATLISQLEREPSQPPGFVSMLQFFFFLRQSYHVASPPVPHLLASASKITDVLPLLRLCFDDADEENSIQSSKVTS